MRARRKCWRWFFPRQLETLPNHSGQSVLTFDTWSPTSCLCSRSPRARVWWSVACTRECGCRFYFRCFSHSWWDMLADLDAIHTSNWFLRTKDPTREYRGWFSTSLNFNKHVQITENSMLLLLSCGQYHMEILCNVQAGFLAMSPMRKVHSKDHSPNVGAFGFLWFLDYVWMTPSAGPNSYFFEHNCSRDDGVRLGIESCHPTILSLYSRTLFIIRRNVNCNSCCIFLFISIFSCVCTHTCLRNCIHLELWILYIREHANHYITFFSWSFVQSTLFAIPDALSPENFGASSALPSSLPFPSPFELRCGEPVGEGERSGPFPLLSCSCHAWMRMLLQMNVGLSWSNGCSLLSRSCVRHFILQFSFAFPLLGALSSSRVLVLTWGSLIFLLETSLGHQLQSAMVVLLVA